MTQSGWSIERVFGLSVERINDLHNAPTASGPSPEIAPEFRDFKRAMHLFRKLQLAHEVEFGADENNHLHILLKTTPENHETLNELSALLNFKKMQDEQTLLIKLENNFLRARPNMLRIRPRSIASIMYYLSQNVAIPPQHVEEGWVTVTKTRQGTAFNWTETPAGEFFQVSFSEEYPKQAFIAVPYLGYWFYIAKNDLKSKSTFMLLTQLFDLQAGQSKYSGPTLTLPVR